MLAANLARIPTRHVCLKRQYARILFLKKFKNKLNYRQNVKKLKVLTLCQRHCVAEISTQVGMLTC